MMDGRFEQALEQAAAARTHRQGREPGEMITCAALIALDREGEARSLIASRDREQILGVWPIVLSRMPFEDPAKLNFLVELLATVVPELATRSLPAGKT
jgi:hypothetical protein